MSLDLGTLVGYLMMDTKGYNDPLDESSSKTEGFARNAPVWMGVATGAIIAAAIAAGGALLSLGGTFDEQSDSIAISTGATGAELQGLIDSADRVGQQVPVSIDKIGPVLATLNSRMGLTGDTLETVGSQILNAGRMMGEDLDINTATGAFNNFHLAGSEVSGALDFLFQTTQRTGIGMNDLIAQTAAAAPITQQLGFTFQETAGMIGTMDKAGLDSGAMIAGMKKGLSELTQPGESAQDAFKRVTGEIQGFIASGDDAAAMDLAAAVFGTRGAPNFIAALKDGSLNMDDLTASTALSGQGINDMASKTDDFAETWQLLVNNAMIALKPIAEEVFGFVSDVMKQVADNVGPAFAWIGENKQLLENFAAVVLSFAAAFLIVQGAITAYNVIMGIYQAVTTAGSIAQWLLNVAMTANPIGIIIVAVGLLIAAIVLLVMNWDTVIKFLGDAWAGFVGWFGEVMDNFILGWQLIWNTIVNFVQDVWNGFVGWLAGVMLGFVNWYIGIWVGIFNFVADIWNGFVYGVQSIWAGFVGWITDGLNLFFLGWQIIWSGVSSFISDVWTNITSGVTNAWNGITSFLGSIPDTIIGFFSGIGTWLWNAGRDLINGLLNGIQSLAGTIGSFFLDLLPDWIVDPFKLALGIHSPSTVFRAFGINIGEGLMEGIADMQPEIDANIGEMVKVPTYDRGTMGGSTSYDQSRTTTVLLEGKTSLDEEDIFNALGSPRIP